jgi:DNA helicase HerA-like ATPase
VELTPAPGLLDDGHLVILGLTGSGKSYLMHRLIEQWEGATFTVDPQDEGLPGDLVTRRNTLGDIVRELKAGGRLVYAPRTSIPAARKVMDALVPVFLNWEKWEPPLLVTIDEAQIFAPEGRYSMLEDVALRGRKWQVRLALVTQRPAELSKGVITQCAKQVIFETAWEAPYFTQRGIPMDQAQALLQQGGQYSYVVHQNGRLAGPYRE